MFNKLQSMIGGNNFRLNWKFFIIMLAVSLLIAAIIYVYKTYVAPKLNPQYVANKEFANSSETNDSSGGGGGSGRNKIAHITLFTASWCPHCRKLKKEGIWDEFTKQNNERVINGYTLNIQEKDCSNDSDPNTKTLLDQYKVDGFPSIKLLKDGDDPSQAIDYDAKPQIDSLNQFVSTVL